MAHNDFIPPQPPTSSRLPAGTALFYAVFGALWIAASGYTPYKLIADNPYQQQQFAHIENWLLDNWVSPI